MKKTLLAVAFSLISLAGIAQTKVTKDASGNYVVVIRKAVKDTAQFTGHTFIDSKGKEWPVYLTGRGGLYYLRTSKAGNVYKVYIKEQ